MMHFTITDFWLISAAFFTALACGLPGVWLVLRRMSLTGDAISHSVLPGIVIGFLASGSLDSPWLVIGAAACGWLAVMGIDRLHYAGGVREDAATGIVFTTMFALGVLMMHRYGGRVDLDPDCVLFGQIDTAIHGKRVSVGGMEIPGIVATSGFAALLAAIFVFLAHHRLLASAFDAPHARLLARAPDLTRALLLAVTAAVVVAAFQTVGAIMTLALLVLPGATALLVARRMPGLFAAITVHAALSAVLGHQLAGVANCNFGAAVVIAGAALFTLTAVAARLRLRPQPTPEERANS
jgi:manganese/zinc/iron transport system permease protein